MIKWHPRKALAATQHVNLGHRYMIARDTGSASGGKQFASIEDYESLRKLVVDVPGEKHYFECIRENRGHLLYFDADWAAEDHPGRDFPNPEAFLDDLISSLRGFLSEAYGLAVDSKDFRVSSANRQNKLSFHLLLDVEVPNEAARKEFKAQLVRARREAAPQSMIGLKGCPDSNVYGHEQLFRMLFCAGVGKPCTLQPVVLDRLGRPQDKVVLVVLRRLSRPLKGL